MKLEFFMPPAGAGTQLTQDEIQRRLTLLQAAIQLILDTVQPKDADGVVMTTYPEYGFCWNKVPPSAAPAVDEKPFLGVICAKCAVEWFGPESDRHLFEEAIQLHRCPS